MIQDCFDPVYFTHVQELKNKQSNQTIKTTMKYKEICDNFPVRYTLMFYEQYFKTKHVIFFAEL
jgi:hypothetical protein